MNKDLLILEDDKNLARRRITELDDEIMSLGPEFYNAFNETSETYHDNAPFEFVRDKQTSLSTELQNLKHILKNSLPSIPKQKKGIVGIGSVVTVLDIPTGQQSSYFIAGDWTFRAGHQINGSIVMSRNSPLALLMLNKKVNDEIFHKSALRILSIKQ